MKKMKLLSFAFLSALFAGAAFAGVISVENPYVKEVASNMKNSAAFMTIKKL